MRTSLLEGPLDLEAPVNPSLSVHNRRVITQKLISQHSVSYNLLSVMKQKQDALLVNHKRKFCLVFKTLMLAIPATKTVEFCAFVYLKNERKAAN